MPDKVVSGCLMVKFGLGRRCEIDEGCNSGAGRCICDDKVVILEFDMGARWLLKAAVGINDCCRIRALSSVDRFFRVGAVSIPRSKKDIYGNNTQCMRLDRPMTHKWKKAQRGCEGGGWYITASSGR